MDTFLRYLENETLAPPLCVLTKRKERKEWLALKVCVLTKRKERKVWPCIKGRDGKINPNSFAHLNPFTLIEPKPT